MPLFLTFIIFNIHSYNTIFMYLHRFSPRQEKPPWGAEPKQIETHTSVCNIQVQLQADQ